MGAVLGWLIAAAGTLVGKVLISLGITYFSYLSLDTMIGAAKTHFFASLGGLDPVTVGILGVLKVGQSVTMLCSALVGRLTLSGLTSSGLRKMVFK